MREGKGAVGAGSDGGSGRELDDRGERNSGGETTGEGERTATVSKSSSQIVAKLSAGVSLALEAVSLVVEKFGEGGQERISEPPILSEESPRTTGAGDVL